MVALLTEFGAKPRDTGPDWVPFIYVDMLTVEIAAEAERVAFEAGFPIRSCASFGTPQFVRMAVRPPKVVQELVAALRASKRLMAMVTAQQS
jgi:histidinol-phosphate/aromatic aminotransferase/cobyric acid decarboxylase-like protein